MEVRAEAEMKAKLEVQVKCDQVRVEAERKVMEAHKALKEEMFNL
jgi:hypothetical protein